MSDRLGSLGNLSGATGGDGLPELFREGIRFPKKLGKRI